MAHAKRRHVVRRVRPRARPASAGRALELSGCETGAGINCDAPMAAELPDRPTDQDLQAVCRRRIDVLIGCSAAQVGGVTRPTDHPFAARRCLTIEPVAHRQSSEYPTTLWASGCMGWPLDASRGLPQDQQVARAPQARCDRVLCRYCAIPMPIGSAVAEVVTDSTLVAHSLTLPSCAAWSRRSNQLRKLRTRQDGRTVSRVGLYYWSPDSGG